MSFTKIAAAGIGSTELVTLHSLEVLNNATVGGVLTYEDVTNVDSIGIVTARAGVLVGSGITLSKDGDIFATGVTTTGSLVSSGAISGTTGTFTGAISGTTGTFTGDVSIPDTIVHTGDTDTKIRFPDANQISFETAGAERMIIGSSGNIGIEDVIQHKGDTNTKIRFPSNDVISFETGGDERLRFHTDGKIFIGKDTNRQTRLGASSFSPEIQIESNTVASASITRFSDNDAPSRLILQKGRGTIASPSAVQDGDAAGMIGFSCWDGDNFTNTARITSEVDGTPGDDDMPGNLIFYTTADGALSPTERFRITSTGRLEQRNNDQDIDMDSSANGQLKLDGNGYNAAFALNAQGLNIYHNSNGRSIILGTNETERIRIAAAGQILTGHDTASTNFHDPQTTTNRTPTIQIHGGNSVQASAALVSWSSSAGSYYSNALYLAHSGSSTIGTNGIVSGSNTLGSIVFSGDDGDEFIKGAMISAHVDGTPGANDMPARLQFWTNDGSDAPAERMRITADGSVIVGYAGDVNTMFYVGYNTVSYVRIDNINANTNAIIVRKNTSGTYAAIRMVNTNGHRGSLNVTNSGVALANASDYRLKENETTISDGITRVKQLIPRRFNFKTDSTTVDGFFAHEVSPVVPESVFGEKDATIDEDGDGYQMLDQSKLVPVLTAAIKELIAEVETLKTEVAALKG